MNIDKYKIKVSTFAAELEAPLNRDLRTILQTEVEIYEVSTIDNQDGTFDEVYKSKVVGSTIVKQGDNKPIIGKSKRSASQRLRWAFNDINESEDFYQIYMNKLIENLPEVIEFLKNK